MSYFPLCQEFLSLSQVLGHPLPTEVQTLSKSSKALKRGSGGTATPDFRDLNFKLERDISPAQVYLVQKDQFLPQVAKCCQVHLEAWRTPDVHLLNCSDY